MFTGIIEQLGIVKNLVKENDNLHLTIEADFTNELKIDQSVAHNGICLTVIAINGNEYTVTAIKETLEKTNLAEIKTGDILNLERCMVINGRLDGHIVQGHVDTTGVIKNIVEENGSWAFTIQYSSTEHITVSKGSICINGISLTVVDATLNQFSVAIIPYTYEHTNMKNLVIGSKVNLEFDIIGKYVGAFMSKKH